MKKLTLNSDGRIIYIPEIDTGAKQEAMTEDLQRERGFQREKLTVKLQ